MFDDVEDDLEDLRKAYGVKIDPLPRPAQVKGEDSGRTPDRLLGHPRRPHLSTPKGFGSSPAGATVYTPVAYTESENYGSRTGRGEVLFKYNGDSSSWSKANEGTRWSVEILKGSASHKLNAEQRVMFQKTRDMSMKMNSMVHEMAMTIISEQDLEGYQSLKESNTEEAVYVGRIRGAGNGKLSATDICFEGTLESSSGHVVSLDLSKLEEYFFYPGQVVVLGGCVSLGKCLTVSSVEVPRPLSFHDEPVNVSQSTGPLSILVAAGPFTPNDSLKYEAFDDLLAKIKEYRPGLVILFGPFMDEGHPKIDEFVETQESVFESFFNDKIKQLKDLNLRGTQFVVVASSKDIHHIPVFPTMPYDLSKADAGIKEVVTVVPDPCMISVNGVVIGLTATDILMHMQKTTLVRATIHTDRFSRIAKELLTQRSFYPLYPPNENVPLDIGLWTEHARMDVKPHILILPSELNHFIKDVDKTIVMNPGRLAAGKRTYARLHVELPENAVNVDGSIADYAMGEILKI